MMGVSAGSWRWVVAALGLLLLIPCGLADSSRPEITFQEDPQTTQVTLNLTVPAPVWQKVNEAWVPRIEGFGSMGLPGQPDLPLRLERVALPPDGDLEILEVLVDWAEGSLPGDLAPFPAYDPNRPAFDDSVYQSRNWWPADPVVIADSRGAFRTLRFATLEIHPLQVDLRAGIFRVARTMAIRMRRGGASGLASSAGVPDLLTEELAGQIAWGSAGVGRSGLKGSTVQKSTGFAADTMGSPTYPAWQIKVDKEGLYRLDYAYIAANAPGLLSQDPRRWRMSVQGIEIPIRVDGESDGVFQSGDALVFYGQPVGDVDLFETSFWQHGDYTDTNIYRIDLADNPLRLQDRAGTRAPTGSYALTPSFRFTVHHEINNRFTGIVPAEGVDHWYIEPLLSANGSPVYMDQMVSTPDHAGGSVNLRVRLLGTDYTKNYHRTRIEVDGTVRDTQDWDGHREFTHGATSGPVAFTPATPFAATTKVTVRLPLGRTVNGSAITKDECRVNWIELDYDRLFRAAGDVLIWDAANSNQEIHLDNFSASPEIWDLSDTVVSTANQTIARPSRVQGVTWTGGQARFEFDGDATLAGRRFIAAATTAFLVPATGALRQDLAPSTLDSGMGESLKSTSHQADWVVVGYRDFLTGPRLQDLVIHRQSQGYLTAVIDIQDIFDEFTFGIEDPQALRDFMAYAVSNWNRAPSFLLLIGDATRDYKNYYGHSASRQFMLTSMWDLPVNSQFGYYPSDTWFTAVVGTDPLPDVMVGRIPAHTLAEAEAAFQKTLNYETNTAWSPWKGRTCMVSEYEKDPGGNQVFYRPHDEIYSEWFSGQGPQTATKAYELLLDEDCQGSGTPANNRIDACLNDGAVLVTFVGHGQYKGWGKTCSLFDVTFPGSSEANDLDDLVTTDALSFHVHANCITGHFPADTTVGNPNDTWYSFLEAWMIAAGKAAVGGLAPSHLTYVDELDSILDPVYGGIFGKNKQRLVYQFDSRLRQNYYSSNDFAGVRSFILFGDPALKLAAPAPAPPGAPSITPHGSGELQLTWQASTDPTVTGYRVYRSEYPQGPYHQAGDTSDLVFVDSGLTNCSQYFYYVVARDAQNWESRWSNSNEDCASSGPDCRRGSPFNPDPPHPPNGVMVTDPRLGGRLVVSWNNADRESDVLGYTVYWGESPGTYTDHSSTDADNSSQTIGGLTDGRSYYVAVTANHCTQSSAYSTEVSGVPHLVRGLNPPRSIGQLMVYRVPDGGDLVPDIRLTWPTPTDSVWGVETTVVGFEVYGSTTGPQFRVEATTLLASLPSTTLEWFHENQGTPAAPRWFYIVAAVDADGHRSAFGVEAPGAIEDLSVVKVSSSLLRLDWTPVGQTMDRPPRPLTVSRYNLYGKSSPFTRAECTAATKIPISLFAPPVDVEMPAGSFFCYQVLPEDTHGTEAVW